MKTLTKEHGWVELEQLIPNNWTVSSTYQGWRAYDPFNFVSSTYFDLAGMSQQEKTLFFEAAAATSMYPPKGTGQAAGDQCIVADIMTSSPLSDEELVFFLAYGNFKNGGVLTFDQTIYARVQNFVVDIDTAAWGYFSLMSETNLGSLEATASDRVYSYRVVSVGLNTTSTVLTLAPTRHLLKTEAREEKDYEYLMRLKRSYELQQEPDVDKA